MIPAMAGGDGLLSSGFAGNTALPSSVVPKLGQAKVTGTPSQTQVIYFTIGIPARFPAEMQAAADAVSNPHSSSYRHWLTPAQVGEQFGASPTTVNAVANFLTSKGLTVNLKSPNNMAIIASGTVSQVQRAFSTTIKLYSGPGPRGETWQYRANATPLYVPTNIAPYFQSVTGIETWNHPYPKNTQTLTPPLTRGLYELQPAYLLQFQGQGRTIGISNFDGFRLSNVPLFVNAFGLPIPPGGVGSNVEVVTIGGGSGGGNPGGEGDLDIQMELGTAPLSKIIIYDGTFDLVGVLTKEASENRCDAISESWGWFGFSNGSAQSFHNQHLAMNLQGMTYMVASGDSGTDIVGDINTADPEILTVGGTVATVQDVTGVRVNEVAWSGGGGGWSNTNYSFNVRPAWQTGNGIPSQPNQHLVPDIALQAGGPGAFAIFWNGSQTAFDGTSCSSPAFCGGLAVVEQRLADQNLTPRMGRIQDLIYSQAGRSDSWYDITQGNNGTLLDGNPSNAKAGWDFCGGWGAPRFEGFYNSLLQAIVPIEVVPTDVQTVFGTYLFGDAASVSATDGVTYQIGSGFMSNLGQAATGSAQFTVSQDTVAITADIVATAGVAGGTNNIYLFNWNTGVYDLIGSTPLAASGSTDKTVTVPAANVPSYIGPGGAVNMLFRGHFPIKPFFNQFPMPFTYKIDKLSLQTH